MNQLGGFPLLTLIVFLPVLGAVISLFIPPNRRETFHWLAFLIAVTDLFISLFLYMGWVDDPQGSAQFVDGPWPWIASLGIHYHLSVDGISLYLVLLTTLLIPVAILVAWLQDNRLLEQDQALEGIQARTFWFLLFEAGMLGALTAFDLALFSFFWLMTLLSSFFMIGKDARRSQGAMRFMVAVVIAGVSMLAATVSLSTLQPSFDLLDLFAASFTWQAQAWPFWGIAVALGITGGVFPLHLGYREAHRQASPAVQVLIGSLLLNLGGYGLIRLCLSLFPLAAVSFAPALVILGTIGLIYGVIAALGSKTLSGTLAYWNIAQMGLTVVGVFSMQNLGLHGAVMHMIGRGLGTAALLLLSNAQDGQGSQRQDRLPVSMGDRAALALGFLSVIGVPGLIGFVGQGTLVMGIVRWHWQASESAAVNKVWDWILYALIASGLLIGMWALLRAWRRISSPSTGNKLSRRTVIAIPILLLILFLGLRPLVSNIIGPSAHRLLLEVNAGVKRDLSSIAPPAPSGEIEDQPPASPDEDDRASWVPTIPVVDRRLDSI